MRPAVCILGPVAMKAVLRQQQNDEFSSLTIYGEGTTWR